MKGNKNQLEYIINGLEYGSGHFSNADLPGQITELVTKLRNGDRIFFILV